MKKMVSTKDSTPHDGQKQKKKKKKMSLPQRPEPKWLFLLEKPSEDLKEQDVSERNAALDYLKLQAANVPAAEPPFWELLELVEAFLSNYGFATTARLFSLERSAREGIDGWAATMNDKAFATSSPGLSEIYKEWRSIPNAEPCQDSPTDSTNSSGDESGSDSEVTDNFKNKSGSRVGKEGSSGSSSSESDTSESESDSASSSESSVSGRGQKLGIKRASKARSVSVTSESSSSSSSSSSDSASKEASGESDDRGSQGSVSPSSTSDSKSESSESESGDSIEGNPFVARKKEEASVPIAGNKLVNSEKKDSNGRKGSDSSTTLQATTPPNKPVLKAVLSSSVESTSADSDNAQAAPRSFQPSSAKLGKRKIDATVDLNLQPTNKKAKRVTTPFQRVPADTVVDPRLSSNAYVPYDYADRAHRDLSITKGKDFTKEKNKKKRGS